MTPPDRPSGEVPLVEVLDRVIDRGAVVTGDAIIGLADVDLIRIALRLVVVPADREAVAAPGRFAPERRPPAAGSPTLPAAPVSAGDPASDFQAARRPGGERPGLDRGLAQLVLTVVELLRELLERQAVRRAVRGALTDEQAERLGAALLELNLRMDEVVAAFGLERSDLNLDLGPLGHLL
jgi:Gas vesicle protein K/Gas vesicle protein